MNAQQAAPILNSWRNGQGWAIARVKTDAQGNRYVKYRVVTTIHGTISVNRHSNVLLVTAPETGWIPLPSKTRGGIPLPAQSGPAAQVLKSAQAFMQQNEGVLIIGETGQAQLNILPQLVKTIQPTIRQQAGAKNGVPPSPKRKTNFQSYPPDDGQERIETTDDP